MEGACINIKLIIGNRVSRTGNWFLVPCCEVSVEGAYINMKLRIGNWESGTGNRELVPWSLRE